MPGPSSPVFLGWGRPFLAAVADWLLAEHGDGPHELIVAVPGRRAARRLEELLAERAEALWAPRLVTAGRLPDALLEPSGVRASRLERTLAWADALRAVGPDALRALVREPPAPDDREGWWRLAEELRGLHGDLLAPALRDFADVAAALPVAAGTERRRWELLTRVQRAYREGLARTGRQDPHDARRAELEAGRLRAPPRGVVLAGVSELSGLARAVLRRLDAPVVPLVFAPADRAEGFDELGTVRVEPWEQAEVPLPDDAWEVAERPANQADRVVTVLAGLDPAPAPDEITVGVPDEQVAPFLLRALAAEGVEVRHGAGEPLAGTPVARLLAATADWLGSRSYAAFAALARHPDVHPHLLDDRCADLLARLDDWQADFLPSDGPGPGLKLERWQPVSAARERLDDLLGGLAGRGRRPLSEGTEAVRRWLARVHTPVAEGHAFGSHAPDVDAHADAGVVAGVVAGVEGGGVDENGEAREAREAALARVAEVLDGLDALPEARARELESTPAELLRLVHRLLVDGSPLPPPAAPDATLLLGWLELALDDAPVLVVTGFNDGRVPASRRGHAFLPDRLRTRLGLPDDRLRLARDAHLLTACLASKTSVTVVSGRRTAENDPLLPSRLVFRCPEDRLAARVRRFVGDDPSPSERLAPATDGAAESLSGAAAHVATDAAVATPAVSGEATPEGLPAVPRRTLPRAPDHEVLDGLAVTAFKTFLASPYEFYLRHVLRLETVDDVAHELDPRAFGNVAHAALERFGQSELRDSTRPERIAAFLEEQVDELVRRHGRHAAVAVQVAQLKHRMRRFARDQAARAEAGWRIEHTEWTPATPVRLDVDGVPFTLRGKIDRIDRHVDGRWAIWDYKTGERGGNLRKARGARGPWRDLQLPLYRLLARELGLPDPDRSGTRQQDLFADTDEPSVALGYVELARRDADAGFEQAHDWDQAALDEAFALARAVVRAIRRGEFWEVDDFGRWDPVLSALAGRGLLTGVDEEVRA